MKFLLTGSNELLLQKISRSPLVLLKSKWPSLIGKAKKLKREGYFASESFKEVHVEGFDELEFAIDTSGSKSGVDMIEVDRGKGLIIRFPSVPTLIDYLRKSG